LRCGAHGSDANVTIQMWGSRFTCRFHDSDVGFTIERKISRSGCFSGRVALGRFAQTLCKVAGKGTTRGERVKVHRNSCFSDGKPRDRWAESFRKEDREERWVRWIFGEDGVAYHRYWRRSLCDCLWRGGASPGDAFGRMPHPFFGGATGGALDGHLGGVAPAAGQRGSSCVAVSSSGYNRWRASPCTGLRLHSGPRPSSAPASGSGRPNLGVSASVVSDFHCCGLGQVVFQGRSMIEQGTFSVNQAQSQGRVRCPL
jgi:hypothetical protein